MDRLLQLLLICLILFYGEVCSASQVAVCYFGLTRSTKKVYKTHFEYVFDVLDANHIDYDVFMHTWGIKGRQRVQIWETDEPIDYEEYRLLNPTFYRLDDQDDFTAQLDFGQYFSQELWNEKGNVVEGEWHPLLILNHLCALESQKRVTDMIEESGRSYDIVMYIRPDVRFTQAIDTQVILDLRPNEIAIPDFEHFRGYNDRFAMLCYETAPIYGKRIDGIREFRKTQARIVSEEYVKYVCETNHLQVKFFPFNFDIVRPWKEGTWPQ